MQKENINYPEDKYKFEDKYGDKFEDEYDNDFDDEYDDMNACSATDCTGLIWRAAKDEEELEAYKDIYDFEPPKLKD